MTTSNRYLLSAARLALAWIEADESSHGRKYGTGNALRDAITAAERELAERVESIDADNVRALGFVFNQACQRYELRISIETRLNITPQFDYLTIYQGPVEAVGFELKNRGQLLDLLSGLGIEVAK